MLHRTAPAVRLVCWTQLPAHEAGLIYYCRRAPKLKCAVKLGILKPINSKSFARLKRLSSLEVLPTHTALRPTDWCRSTESPGVKTDLFCRVAECRVAFWERSPNRVWAFSVPIPGSGSKTKGGGVPVSSSRILLETSR